MNIGKTVHETMGATETHAKCGPVYQRDAGFQCSTPDMQDPPKHSVSLNLRRTYPAATPLSGLSTPSTTPRADAVHREEHVQGHD